MSLSQAELDSLIALRSQEVISRACDAHVSLGCAESCTGGLVSGALTAVPGSSEVVRGGIVSYALDVKRAVLGVDANVLADPSLGAVSDVCACQMCVGAKRVLDCDIAVSVTGIAGPGGVEPGKPVGTVWLGIVGRGEPRAECHLYEGDRAVVRALAIVRALELICEEIERLC